MDKAEWQKLAGALRELHRALMQHARLDYEREHSVTLNPAELLRLLMTDAYFEWLRGLSELMVEIDTVQDSGPEAMDELSTAVRQAVEHFVTAPAGTTQQAAPAGAFARRYWPYVQEDPHVAMAHAGVKQALAAWPLAPQSDAATRLHARHVLAEKARHHLRKT